MKLISLKIQIVPESYTTVLKNLNAVIGPTMVQPGCIGCHVYRGVEDSTTLFFIEQWNDEEQMRKHLRSEDFKVILAMMELSIMEPEFSIQTISDTKGIDSLIELRG